MSWKVRSVFLASALLLVACDGGDTIDGTQQALRAGKNACGTAAPTMGHADPHACDPLDTKKTTVCHVPPGNPANAHTICVGNPAVPAHLDHGDYLGACAPICDGGAEPPPPPSPPPPHPSDAGAPPPPPPPPPPPGGGVVIP